MIPPHNDSIWPDDTKRAAETLALAAATNSDMQFGDMVDAKTRKNLTEARLNDHGRINFDSLPLQRAIKVVKGDGSRRFAVFSDPDCPFCQQLEKTMASVTNVGSHFLTRVK